jgi:hypothetical protein
MASRSIATADAARIRLKCLDLKFLKGVVILARVHSQAKQLEDYLEVQGMQPLPTRDLMSKFEWIALFSARGQH